MSRNGVAISDGKVVQQMLRVGEYCMAGESDRSGNEVVPLTPPLAGKERKKENLGGVSM